MAENPKLKMKDVNIQYLEECAKHAEDFMIEVVKAKSPMDLAELFYTNSYLRKDMDGSAKIFYKSLDVTVESIENPAHIEKDRDLLRKIYTFAFADYAKNKGMVESKEADKFVKDMIKEHGWD